MRFVHQRWRLFLKQRHVLFSEMDEGANNLVAVHADAI